MASTGSSCEAPYAGTNPDITPIRMEIVKPRMTFDLVSTISIGNVSLARIVINHTMNNPTNPPINIPNMGANKRPIEGRMQTQTGKM